MASSLLQASKLESIRRASPCQVRLLGPGGTPGHSNSPAGRRSRRCASAVIQSGLLVYAVLALSYGSYGPSLGAWGHAPTPKPWPAPQLVTRPAVGGSCSLGAHGAPTPSTVPACQPFPPNWPPTRLPIRACRRHTDIQTAYQTKLKVDWRTGVAATDWNAIAKKEHLDALTVELRKLEVRGVAGGTAGRVGGEGCWGLGRYVGWTPALLMPCAAEWGRRDWGTEVRR